MACETEAHLRTAVTRDEHDKRRLAKQLLSPWSPEKERHLRELLAGVEEHLQGSQAILDQHRRDCPTCTGAAGSPFRPRLSEDQQRDLIGLIRDGLPWDEIAEAFGVTRSSVLYYAKRIGIDSEREAQPDAAAEAEEPRTSGPAFGYEPWMEQALCAQTDPDSFFPDKGGETRTAKAVCARCLVAAECLDYALTNNERFGIWGGLSERERRRLLRGSAA